MASPATVPAPIGIRRARDTDAQAVIDLLLLEHDLEVAFDPTQFWVAELPGQQGRIVACARLKPLVPDAWEIASVVVHPDQRGQHLGQALARHVLDEASGTVYALALAPGFFARLGFRPLDAVPDPLGGKATSICASSAFVPMALVR